MSTSTERPVARLLGCLRERSEVKSRGKGWRCLCPAHDDHSPSLDVDEGRDGRALLICRSRGCSAASIAAALGLSMRDLFNGTMPDVGAMPFGDRIIKSYDYRDEKGQLLFQAVRLWAPAPKNKEFRQRKPDGRGGWTWSLGDVRRVPYRLPELLAASPPDPVFVVEGEKDADRLAALGLVATTCPMGAGKWRAEFAPFFRGRRVFIIPDADTPGREHAEAVLLSVRRTATSARIVELPGLPPKGDVSYWLDAGGTCEGLLELCSRDPQPVPASVVSTPAPAAPPIDVTTGAGIITEFFRERYRPVFRDGSSIHCFDGREVPQREACSLPDSTLISRLATAEDAPRCRGRHGQAGEVDRDRLPGFFKKWAGVAWGDLIRDLPDEDSAAVGQTVAVGERFRSLVRDALLTQIVLGEVIGNSQVTQTERRALIDWTAKFAKPGPWRSVRSYRIWCRLDELSEGEVQLRVAVRPELFAQVRADKYLVAMRPNTFSRRAARYGVGTSSRTERPQGGSAVVLSAGFLSDLLDTLPDDSIEPAQEFGSSFPTTTTTDPPTKNRDPADDS